LRTSGFVMQSSVIYTALREFERRFMAFDYSRVDMDHGTALFSSVLNSRRTRCGDYYESDD
jgi:hypothetical protein